MENLFYFNYKYPDFILPLGLDLRLPQTKNPPNVGVKALNTTNSYWQG